MNENKNIISEDELHAYVDGQLSPDDVMRVEAHLQATPQDAARVAAWNQQNRDIRALMGNPPVGLPGDAALVSKARPRAWPRYAGAAAAAILLFTAGNISARYWPLAQPADAPEIALSSEANTAYLVYTADVRHPVEVRADEKDHLVAWLGKRVGKAFPSPDLQPLGFDLIGGRLLPVEGNPGALLMYENAQGKRLTVMVGRSGNARDTSFQFASNGPVETFYWIDEQLSYAVTGEVSRGTLQKIAEECYRQFQT
jgi:anti-sigma factor RsiW